MPDELRGLEAHSIEVPRTVFGTFTVRGGQLVNPNQVETQQPSAEIKNPISRTQGADGPGINDQVIPDDLIVQGSLCVGFDCINNETFSFDTFKLKENNTRLTFIDTSSTSGFPAGDWQIRANDSASGGADFLSIDWLGTTANIGTSPVTTPFRVDGGAPNNSLRVSNTGRVGIRTASPVLDLHIATGNTPAFRLEQTNQSGFSAQTWDFAGNEANFFVRDVTGGSRLPFRIRPGAPTSSIDVAASGNVGIGTASAQASLHTRRSDGTAQIFVEEVSSTAAARTLFRLSNPGNTKFEIENTSAGTSWAFANPGHALRLSLQGSGAVELEVDSGGNLIIAGTLTQGSSRYIKEGITAINSAQILEAITSLTFSEWSYTSSPDSRHFGPMAEDFFAAFGFGKSEKHIAPGDMAAVAMAGTKALHDENEALKSRIDALENMLDQLQQEIRQLSLSTGQVTQ